MVEQGKLSRYQTVICAPETYLNSRDENTYDQTISYEKIAAWFASQPNCRAAWRAHVIREAIAQSRRGYAMVKDPMITEFQKKYWAYLQRYHPRILMNEPGDRGPKSTWIILKGHGFPKGVHLNHKINKQLMELAFSKTNKARVLASRPDWPDDLIIAQKGNEATIALITPKIDMWSEFDEQIAAVEEAFKAAERLLQYATVLEQPAVSPTKSGLETTTKVAPGILEQLKAIAKFLPIFDGKNFKFGEWTRAEGELAHFCFSEAAQEFIQMAYDAGWMHHFSWMDWQDTKEALQLRDEPGFLAQADVEQLAKLLTTLIRKDRFVEGELASAYEFGLLTRIIRRAAAILKFYEAVA